jgi:hypothetical protein
MLVYFYAHLEYITAIWYNFMVIWYVCGHLVILWLFGIFFRVLVYVCCQEKSGNPAPECLGCTFLASEPHLVS